jgi:hypothetical protein
MKAKDSKTPQAFDVFLSYSRKDRDIAIRLEEALESYRMPSALKSVTPHLNVFRDEADITAADDYYRAIDQHLSGSGKLVVICSPAAKKSSYVNDEIKRFIQSRGADQVIPVMVAGKPNNETTNDDEMAFPPALSENRMPLAANFVGLESYKGELHKGPYRNAFFSVLAAIKNVDRRALEQIDEKRAARRRVITLSVAGAVILALSVALAFAISSRQEALRQKAIAEEQTQRAVLAKQETEAAHLRLQQQFLEAIAEMSTTEVLDAQAVPGEIRTDASPPWIPLMRQGPMTFAAGSPHGKGRVLAVAHDGVLVGKSERFLKHAFEWLRGPQDTKTVLVSTGHCEWVTLRNLKVPDRLKEQGYTVAALPGPITESALKEASVLVVGNAWGNLAAEEVSAIQDFVARGGGLFAAGLGWSWKAYIPGFACPVGKQGQDANDMSTFPMNRLLKPFGGAWTERTN